MTLFTDDREVDQNARAAPRRTPSRLRVGVSLTLLLLALAGAGAVASPWGNDVRWQVRDQVVVWTQPTPEPLASIADSTAMTDEARRIYLASVPELDDAAALQSNCTVQEVSVLGCYAAERIYIFDVSDERLVGTNEVTAAHEMLHGAFDRLSTDDRRDLTRMIRAYTDSLPQDSPLWTELSSYDDSQFVTEVHSRLGTEVADLPADLEAHYARYFADRSAVLSLYAQSNKVLVETQARITELTAQLDAANADIEARQAAWDIDSDSINSAVSDFNARADAGDFDSQAQFSRERAALQGRLDANESERVSINAQITSAQALVDELNALGSTTESLYASLDSRTGGLDG